MIRSYLPLVAISFNLSPCGVANLDFYEFYKSFITVFYSKQSFMNTRVLSSLCPGPEDIKHFFHAQLN